MSDDARAIHPAEERLLDAALAQVFADRRHGAAPAAGAAPWLAAALVLLGVLVTTATMWLARAKDHDALQEPAPLPNAVSAEGRAAIEALPADTQNLIARILSPGDTDVFTRFRSLKKLALVPLDVHIGPINTRKKMPSWSAPPSDVLAPLAALPALESLQISSQITVSPGSLAPLAASRSLRELQLAGDGVRIDDAFVEALAAIPSLRALRFDLVQLDAAAIVRLRRLALTALTIERPLSFDAAAWDELCRLSTLEDLSLSSLGRSFSWQGKDVAFWMPAPEQLGALGSLPKLRRVELQACACTDDHLSALPDSLTSLRLRYLDLTPDGFGALRRFGGLRELDLNTERYGMSIFAQEPVELRRACAGAIAEALGTLRLTELRFEGAFTDELRRAIVDRPDLAVLTLYPAPTDGFDELARAPALRRLVLRDNTIPTRMTPEALAPLRGCRSLRQLELLVHDVSGKPAFDDEALRKQLGEHVELHVQHEVFTVK